MTVQKGLIDTNLTSIRGDLHAIQRGQPLPNPLDLASLSNILETYASLFVCALDDIDGIISSAKSLVRNANDITNEVLDGLNPIQTDVERIKDTYGSTQSEDFNKALSDADNSGSRCSLARMYYLFSPSLCALVRCNFSPVKSDLRN